MKKRILSFLLMAALVLALLPLQTHASTASTREEIEYLPDGGYIVTTIEESANRASGTKSGTKTKSGYDNSGNLDWQIVLKGQFSYTGSSATCTSATITVNIYDDAYHKDSSSATKSGNTARGSATIKRKVLGITISTDTYNLTLSCDSNGNLS